jgi:hypothetical protein
LQALDFGLADTCCGAPVRAKFADQAKEASGKQRARAVRMISQEETEGYSHLSELPPGRTAIRGLPEGTKFWQLGWHESVEQHREAHVRVCSVVAEAIMQGFYYVTDGVGLEEIDQYARCSNGAGILLAGVCGRLRQ